LDAIYTASQGSTQAGILLGCELLDLPTRVVGVNPMFQTHEAYIAPDGVLALAHRAASMLGFESRLTPDDVVANADFVGPGYGEVSEETLEAIHALATSEGVLLDPVYTGKAFAALLSHIRAGRFSTDETVVFLHTGGLPALFAYADELAPHDPRTSTPPDPGGTPKKSRKVPRA
jgi:1-aminocyclopropane-1-carboxylate deaminase/D-cysteine desulfhydrase-like pyridoxal-dependent ACC family enzyme